MKNSRSLSVVLSWTVFSCIVLAPPVSAQAETQTRATQAALTPDEILKMLKAGNERFVSGKMLQRDLHAQVKQTASGQYPMAAIMGCLDSRVPPELVFDMGIGDLFVGRVAGNYVDTDMLGSFEFATKVAGAKVILVLGHTECGAVKGACDGVQIGNLTHTLSNLAPALYAVRDVEGPRNAGNKKFVDAVTRANVELNVQALVDRSAVLRDLVKAGKLKIVGGIYDVKSGRVTFLDQPVSVKRVEAEDRHKTRAPS
jgi:carbonic anhydrase